VTEATGNETGKRGMGIKILVVKSKAVEELPFKKI